MYNQFHALKSDNYHPYFFLAYFQYFSGEKQLPFDMQSKATTPKATTSLKYVCDKRWSNNEAKDELHVIYEGPASVENDRVIETSILYHVTFDCYELIVFQPPAQKVWARFYFPKENLRSKLCAEDYDRIVEEKKDFFRKRHRHFDLDTLKSGAKNELLKRVILSLVPDLLSFDLSHRLQDESNPAVKDIFNQSAVFNGYDLQSVTYIAPKPDFLVPTNVVPDEVETSYSMFVIAQRQFNACHRGTFVFQSTIGKKYKVCHDSASTNVRGKTIPVTSTTTSSTATTPTSVSSTMTMSGKLRTRMINIRESFSTSARNTLAIYAPSKSSGKSSSPPSPATPSGPSVAQRIGSFIGRRLSIITNLRGSVSLPSAQTTANQSLQIKKISLARYRWLLAIHKVLFRNSVTRYRQILLRQAMMTQLRRVILRQRSDYALLMQQKIVEDHAPGAPSPSRGMESPTSHSGSSPRHTMRRLNNNSTPNGHHTTTSSSSPSPTVTYRNLSTMCDHHHNGSSPRNTTVMVGSVLKAKPMPAALAVAPVDPAAASVSSFRSTLSQVRNKIAAATAFARFEHLKINTKVGADATASTPTPAHHSGHHHSSNQQEISGRVRSVHAAASSGASVSSTATASTAGTARSFRSVHHGNINNNNNSVHADSPLMRHASRRVAAAN